MKDELILIYNYPLHYRRDIFICLDQEFKVSFNFGDYYRGIKKMDTSVLSNVNTLKNIKLWGPIYYQKGAIGLLRKPVKKYLILGESICVSTWIILIAGFIMRKEIYLWTHGWYGKESWLRRKLKIIFFGLSKGVFLYGNYARNLMIEAGFCQDRLHVIYNSLNYSDSLRIRSEIVQKNIYRNNFNNDFANIVFIGRLTNEKQLHLLLEAMHLLHLSAFFLNVTFIGDGESEEVLRKLGGKLGLVDKIWFYGSCYDEAEIAHLIYEADLCVSPGNVGLTCVHSMMYGTPVITHDDKTLQMPEFEAIQPGITGAFFKRGCSYDLAQSIKTWLDKVEDRDLVRKHCYFCIDNFYNADYQMSIIKKVI